LVNPPNLAVIDCKPAGDINKKLLHGNYGIEKKNPAVETAGCKPKPTAYEKNLELLF
jgi:hypothetical protein